MLSLPSRQLLSAVRTQLEPEQVKYCWHWVAVLQEVRHAPPEQAKPLAHVWLVPVALQAPAPLQKTSVSTATVASLQLFIAVEHVELHCVVEPGYPHAVALDPLQVPPQVVPTPAHAVRVPCGCPELTVVQLPSAPGTSHAWHCPPQAPLQQ